ncbi:MAG: hypothetical protein LBU11_11470 [Zoogloeaceae bacterium]|nr:hypothetical protein [Zoogloeaceae bacterium]
MFAVKKFFSGRKATKTIMPIEPLAFHLATDPKTLAQRAHAASFLARQQHEFRSLLHHGDFLPRHLFPPLIRNGESVAHVSALSDPNIIKARETATKNRKVALVSGKK